MLSDKLVECLICPVCRESPLSLAVEETDGERLVKATLTCPGCKRWFPVHDDIPVMMPPDLGANLAAADDCWEHWGAAMHRFLRWREAAWADPNEAAERSERARAMHQRFLEFCDLPRQPIELLDVGCGTGHVADLLPESVCYVGLDPLSGGRSPTGEMPAEIPRPQREVTLVQGVGELLPIADDSFDVVLMIGMLDHARNTSEVLGEAARVLRPGGLLGVLVGLAHDDTDGGVASALRSLWRSLMGLQSPRARDTHLHTFSSEEEVAALLSDRFDVRGTMQHSKRAFVRATASVDQT